MLFGGLQHSVKTEITLHFKRDVQLMASITDDLWMAVHENSGMLALWYWNTLDTGANIGSTGLRHTIPLVSRFEGFLIHRHDSELHYL